MDDFMDRLWALTEAGLISLAGFLDMALSPLEILGPGGVILILAFGVVGFTRLASRVYTTQRLKELKKEFDHWHAVRQEAAQYHDREKGRAMARNIDQAKLNQVYYDYFFEGLLKSLLTNVLPILLMLAYLSRTYTAEALAARFGRPWVFSLELGSSVLNVGTLFWYTVCILCGFIVYSLGCAALEKRRAH